MSLRTTVEQAALKTKALPAAAATAYTDSIEVGTGIHVKEFEVRLELPALPALVDAKTVTVTLQDSADNTTFADIEELATLVVTGAGGVGCTAATREVRLPSSTEKYIRAKIAVLTAGGDNTAKSLTLSVLS